MPEPTYYARLLKKYLQIFGAKVEEEVYDGHKHIDLSIPRGRLDIEVDGMQHLTDPHQIVADYERAIYSREDGFETVHVHNMDLENHAKEIAHAIAEVSQVREKDLDELAGIK